MIILGLGLPIHRPPLITILAIIVCTIKYFSVDIAVNKKAAEHYREFEQIIKKTSAAQEFRLEFCNKASAIIIDCQSFAKEDHLDRKKQNIQSVFTNLQVEMEYQAALGNKSKEVMQLKSYQKFDDVLSKERQILIAKNKKLDLLSKHHQTWKSYLLSLFTHGSFMHLFGNMLALLVFGIYVEAKIGSLAFLASFMITGLASFYIYINNIAQPHMVLVGASGAISGIMGIFYVSFYKHYLRFWLFFKTFLLPVKYYFPLFFIANDIILHLEGNTNIAAMAHLSGSVTGMMLYFLFGQKFKTPEPFIYNEELAFYHKNRKNKVINIEQFQYWLKRNPLNYRIRGKLIFTLWENKNQSKIINKEELDVLIENTRKFMGRSIYYKDNKSILRTLKMIPLNFGLSQFLNDFTLDELIKMYNLCMKNGDLAALRVGCVLLDKKINTKLRNTIIYNFKESITYYNKSDINLILNSCNHKQSVDYIYSILNNNLQESA